MQECRVPQEARKSEEIWNQEQVLTSATNWHIKKPRSKIFLDFLIGYLKAHLNQSEKKIDFAIKNLII